MGARPQFIKASVISRIINNSNTKIEEVLVHSGQHYDENMSEIFFLELGISAPKYYINSNKNDSDIQFGEIMSELKKIILIENPDLILVYGDTNTTLAASITANKCNIKLAHIESGCRSYRKGQSEEINRVITDQISDILFCNSALEKLILKKEKIKGKIFVVGDIMFDSYLYHLDKIKINNLNKKNNILFTLHRSENVDNYIILKNIINFINHLSKNYKILFPIHPRTNLKLDEFNIKLSKNITITKPQSYSSMLENLINSNMVITDSGGLQKEAYYSKKKCFTLRDETEWGVTLKKNANTLISPKMEVKDMLKIFNNSINKKIVFSENVFGDGKSGKKIIEILLNKV